MRCKRRFVLLAFLLSAAACSGGGGGGSAVPTVKADGATAPAQFTIRWPSAAAHTAGAREPKYISPSTLSVVVGVNGNSALTTVANYSGTPSSTISIAAPVGADEFTISLYDEKQPQGATTFTGHVVGSTVVDQTITAGKLNTLTAIVNGVVASVRIDAAPNQSGLRDYGATVNPRFGVVGALAGNFVVTPLDADGNAIVGPGLAPSLTFLGTGQSFTVVPSTSTPGQFAVYANQPDAAAGTVTTLTASASDSSGNTVTQKTTVEQLREIYVAYRTASGSHIGAFDDAGAPVTLDSGAFPGLKNPVALTYDQVDHIVFAADAGLNEILAFDPSGNPLGGFAPPTLAGVNGVAWWTDGQQQDAVVATSATQAIVFSPVNGGLSNPNIQTPFPLTGGQGVAFMPPSGFSADMLLVGDTTANQLDAYTTYGQHYFFGPSTFPLASPAGSPTAMIAGANDSVYVSGTASGSGELWLLNLSAGTSTSIADANSPQGVAYDATINRLFVADSATGNVSAYMGDLSARDAAHTLAAPSQAGVSTPQGVTVAY